MLVYLTLRIKKFVSVSGFSSVETKSRFSMIPFAVLDIKHKFFRIPFFRRKFQKLIVKKFTMNFQHSFSDQPAVASFNTMIGKKFPFLFFTHQIISENQPLLNPILLLKALKVFQRIYTTKFLFFYRLDPSGICVGYY